MYALKTWETPAKTMLEKYREYLTDDEVFVMTAAEQLKQLGAFEKARETAIHLLSLGDSLEKIEKVTGLKKSIIEKLNKTNSKTKKH